MINNKNNNSNKPPWELSEASLYIGLHRKQPLVDSPEQAPATTKHHHSVQSF